MKYAWVDGKIKFYTHKKDGRYYFDGVEGSTPIEAPSAELVAKCEGKTFANYSEAKAFVEGGCPKSELEILRETVDTLVINALGV